MAWKDGHAISLKEKKTGCKYKTRLFFKRASDSTPLVERSPFSPSCRRKGRMCQDWLRGGPRPKSPERESHCFLAGVAKDLPRLKSGPAWWSGRWWAVGSKRLGCVPILAPSTRSPGGLVQVQCQSPLIQWEPRPPLKSDTISVCPAQGWRSGSGGPLRPSQSCICVTVTVLAISKAQH